MTRLLSFFLLILSFSAWSQTDEEILNDKFRPLVFQLEKSLNSSLKERLSGPYPNEIMSVQVKLTLNTAPIFKRLGITTEKSKFALPALDDSNEIANDKVINFNPTMSDILSVVTKMDVAIISSDKLSVAQTSDIQQIIESEVSTLGIKNVAPNFTVRAPTKPKEETNSLPNLKEEAKKIPDLALPLGIVISGLLTAMVISIFLHRGMKRIETNIKELNNGLANLGSASAAPRTDSYSNSIKEINSTNSSLASNMTNEEDLQAKLQKTIHQYETKIADYFDYIIDTEDPSKMLVLLEAMSDQERANWQRKMPEDFKREYDLFINYLQTNSKTDEILIAGSRDIIRDFKLLPHDENYLIKKSIKFKINLLKKEDIPKVIENSNESEFAYLLELIEPVLLASTLALNPQLLSKYSKISTEKLDPTQLKKLSEKLTRYTAKSKTKSFSDISLFLSPEVEAEFNKKSGRTQNSWESFSESELAELEKFARSLNVNELSSFIAILPEELKGNIMAKLPEIKAQQLQRFGIKLTDESFRLKHQFFARTSKGAVQ